jgi:hypothetical protein
MAAALDIRQKQRAVIEFLVCENDTVGNIHKRLQKVYGDDAVDCTRCMGMMLSVVGLSDYLGKVDMPISTTSAQWQAAFGTHRHHY